MTAPWTIRAALLAGALAVAAIGCEEPEPIRVYQAPKIERAVEESALHFGPFHAEVPEGWSQVPAGSGFTTAALEIDPAHPELRCTVSAAGGELLANINRWRGQVGLDPVGPDQLETTAPSVEVAGFKGHQVDLVGEEKRMLGLILPAGGQTWFVKLMGPKPVIEKHAERFGALIESIRLEEGAHDG